MKYEIITDNEDFIVLIVHNRVIATSTNIEEIVRILAEDYTACRNRTERKHYLPLKHAKKRPVTKENKPLGNKFSFQELFDKLDK